MLQGLQPICMWYQPPQAKTNKKTFEKLKDGRTDSVARNKCLTTKNTRSSLNLRTLPSSHLRCYPGLCVCLRSRSWCLGGSSPGLPATAAQTPAKQGHKPSCIERNGGKGPVETYWRHQHQPSRYTREQQEVSWFRRNGHVTWQQFAIHKFDTCQ